MGRRLLSPPYVTVGYRGTVPARCPRVSSCVLALTLGPDAMPRSPGTWCMGQQQWDRGRGSPVVKRCLVGWSGGLFMLPGAAGEDWVRPRAWWGTVARLRGAWYTCRGCSCWASVKSWKARRSWGEAQPSRERGQVPRGPAREPWSSPDLPDLFPPPPPTCSLQGQETLQPSLHHLLGDRKGWGGRMSHTKE